jgi:hypothetical protein
MTPFLPEVPSRGEGAAIEGVNEGVLVLLLALGQSAALVHGIDRAPKKMYRVAPAVEDVANLMIEMISCQAHFACQS